MTSLPEAKVEAKGEQEKECKGANRSEAPVQKCKNGCKVSGVGCQEKIR